MSGPDLLGSELGIGDRPTVAPYREGEVWVFEPKLPSFFSLVVQAVPVFGFLLFRLEVFAGRFWGPPHLPGGEPEGGSLARA